MGRLLIRTMFLFFVTGIGELWQNAGDEDVSFVHLKQRVSHVPLSVPIDVPSGGI